MITSDEKHILKHAMAILMKLADRRNVPAEVYVSAGEASYFVEVTLEELEKK